MCFLSVRGSEVSHYSVASRRALEGLISSEMHEIVPAPSVDDVAMGFIDVANETMCRPIRSLTQAKGFDTAAHTLACFGGAGGQHACAIAQALGLETFPLDICVIRTFTKPLNLQA
jgi:N-methylhydantoinase A/oxoprolinase/acetone carboxylase beta subunit